MEVRYAIWGRFQDPPRHEYISAREEASIKTQLRQIVSRGRTSVCFLPTQTWFCNGFQRPQQMARAFAELGCPAIFCEPWDCADVWLTAETVEGRRFRGLKQLGDKLWLLRYPPEKLNTLLHAAMPGAIIMSWPYQDPYVRGLDPRRVIYEMIDDHSLMETDAQWHATHERWVRDAAVVAASADDLFEELRRQRHDTVLVANGVRIEDWSLDGPVSCPEDLAPARKSDVVVGYYGAIADWFDWNLWLDAARRRPQWAFVLIGYAYDGDNAKVHARIRDLPNIHFLGGKPYGQLPAYLAHFDVATIPFLLNPITHGCSPVKLFEYMAAGKPIVCTPMREILKYRSIRFAESAAAFVEQIEAGLAQRTEPAFQRLLCEEAESNTWRARAGTLLDALERTKCSGRTQLNLAASVAA